MTEARMLSIRQPWAQLIAEGVKDVENRTWHTQYRGLLLIHAGQRYDDDAHADPIAAAAFVDDDRVRTLKRSTLPKGAIIAVAELVDVHSYRDEACRDAYTGGPCSLWAQHPAIHWRLQDVRKLTEPVLMTGSLGLRKVSDETLSLVLARVPK